MGRTNSDKPTTDAAESRKRAAYALLGGERVDDPGVVADLLQRATEELNPLIVRAEKALAGLNLNVPACITLLYDSEERWGQYLGFRKEGRDWGLFVDTGHDGIDPAEWEHVRLQTASRETRLNALSRLPELEKELVAEANRQCANALKIVADTDTYLAALEGRKP